MTALPEQPGPRLEVLQARLGARLAAGLSERAAAVPHDVSERLRVGREHALQIARQRRRALELAAQPAPAGALAGRTRGGVLLGHRGFWHGLALGAPLLVFVLGLVLIQHWARHEQVQAAAEVDAMLLSDDLPPAAWTDPGFREFLRSAKP
jgi:hypothetical protein